MIPSSKLLPCAILALGFVTATAAASDRKIIMLAGPPSHGPGFHEYHAGLLLFQKCLAGFPRVDVEVYNTDNAWVPDESVFDGAAAVVLYSDGGPLGPPTPYGSGHPFLRDDRLRKIGELMRQGVGLGLIHYAVEPTKQRGEKEFIDWVGGAFETYYSVNAVWRADFLTLPVNPVTRGVKPYSLTDEWYYHIRFRPGMEGVTPILTAIPPESSVQPGESPYHGNASVREAVRNQDTAKSRRSIHPRRR